MAVPSTAHVHESSGLPLKYPSEKMRQSSCSLRAHTFSSVGTSADGRPHSPRRSTKETSASSLNHVNLKIQRILYRFQARCEWTALTCSRPSPCAYVRRGGFEMQAGATNFLAVLQSMFPRLALPQACMMRNCSKQQLSQVHEVDACTYLPFPYFLLFFGAGI
jgi:hypothetical protein